jgi:hypothetical protein
MNVRDVLEAAIECVWVSELYFEDFRLTQRTKAPNRLRVPAKNCRKLPIFKLFSTSFW